jgi:hypothetical protein
MVVRTIVPGPGNVHGHQDGDGDHQGTHEDLAQHPTHIQSVAWVVHTMRRTAQN